MIKIEAIKCHCWGRDNLLVLLVVLLFMSGRFTLARVGVGGFLGSIEWVGPLFVLMALILWWHLPPHTPVTRGVNGGMVLLSLFVVALIISLATTDYPSGGAITGEAIMGILVLPYGALFVYRIFPSALRYTIAWLALFGVLYAVGGLLGGLGPGQRMSAFTAGPGVFARVVIMGLLALLFFGHLYSTKWLLLLPLMVAAVVLSGTRVMWVAGAVAIGVWMVCALREGHTTRRNLIGIVALVALGVGIATVLYPDTVFMRSWALTFQEGYTGGRLEMWGDAVRLIRDHPWFGTGVGSFPVLTTPIPSAYGSAWTEPSWYPHNLFLDAGVAIGVGGIVLLAGIIGWLLWLARKRWDGSLLSITLLSLFLAQFMAQMGSGTFYDGRWMWLFLSVLATGGNAVRRDKGAKEW